MVTNDNNPFDCISSLLLWLHSTTTTNIIVCEIPKNKFLNEGKLNYEIKLLCKKIINCMYVDMNYSRQIPVRSFYSTYVCRSLLKEILHIGYKNEYNNYVMQNDINLGCKHDINQRCIFDDKGTQTVNSYNLQIISKDKFNDKSTQTDENPSILEPTPMSLTKTSHDIGKNIERNDQLFRV